MKDIVFEIISSMLANSPERSYKRLNPALRSCLFDCISADLQFQPDTFEKLDKHCRAVWWMGDGAGSHLGEHYYGQAVALNHATAYQSFEKWAGRPGVLWEYDAVTPTRLYVGKQFAWQGYYVTVTSMREDSLVACTYHKSRNRIEGIRIGAEIGYGNNCHIITEAKKDGKATVLRVLKATERHGESVVAKRFVIKYEEIAEFRRSEARRVKAIVAAIATCNPAKDGPKLTKQVNHEKFRHFQLEVINKAFKYRVAKLEKDKQEKRQAKADRQRAKEIEEFKRTEPVRVEAWRKGKGDSWLDAGGTYLRVTGDLVECSNGNSISRSTAASVLPVLLDRRGNPGTLSSPVDGHTVDRISSEGVHIGCTFVPWAEIDAIAPLLQEETTAAAA